MRTIVGVMGTGEDGDTALLDLARRLGEAIATRGWVLLTGGRACGVMDAASAGASAAGGLVVGVLPDEDTRQASRHLDIPIRTGMGEARNVVNVLSSDVVVAMRGGAGTLSEVALALKAGRLVIALQFDVGVAFEPYRRSGMLRDAGTVEEAITLAGRALEERRGS